ncbi:sulfite exporter TauE/SafE family protein [Streptomyces sp. NPDC057705]|uniref:sulfite exporter TauE/SafE family protein n=1 Tax=Streptomyces sp. NPDC057705 TaxID=3346222 RepID=UPI0036C5901D
MYTTGRFSPPSPTKQKASPEAARANCSSRAPEASRRLLDAVAVNLLAGGLLGAWAGASWAVKMRTSTLYKVLAVLMVVMAAALVYADTTDLGGLGLGPLPAVVGVVAGFGISVVAAMMGVASGELLVPTIVLLYGLDIKVAGSLSLQVSLPTMLVAFGRYSRDCSFSVLWANLRFSVVLAAGSVASALLGGNCVEVVPGVAGQAAALETARFATSVRAPISRPMAAPAQSRSRRPHRARVRSSRLPGTLSRQPRENAREGVAPQRVAAGRRSTFATGPSGA